jgi:hypothetical protein
MDKIIPIIPEYKGKLIMEYYLKRKNRVYFRTLDKSQKLSMNIYDKNCPLLTSGFKTKYVLVMQ